ncbi:nuclear pore complex protein [Tripterygium wilfordii]|uniref:Nuclear pore complex protein n=1 Tax=Tripterygium wilfordii TaxID=458696 RepID=A0A7J7CCB5_TRIWF|nr:nuclear pore complex protein NUP160 [Tripterygium wilfordii]KAF5731788.1 nuclear pore complex protein [Tripterygium wilfordii]
MGISRWRMAGIEVPISGSDSLKWIEVSVPIPYCSDADGDTAMEVPPLGLPQLSASCLSSCSVIGDSPHTSCLISRIDDSRPHAIELLQLSASRQQQGLRISFPHVLSPFVFICNNEIESSSRTPYLLYAVTVSGIVFLLKLADLSSYVSHSVLSRDHFVEFNLHTHSHSHNINNATITSIAAAAGCLVVGRDDGSITSFRLGSLHQSAPGFSHELRDESGINRLWGFMSRGKIAGAVQDLVISDMQGKKYLFVLHSCGNIRVWDLSSYSKIFSHSTSAPTSEGATPVRFWIGETNRDSGFIPMAVLYKMASDVSVEVIYVYSFSCGSGDRIIMSLESSVQNIPLEEGKCIDVQLTSDKIWILKDNGLVSQNLHHSNSNVEEQCYYALGEEFVAEQLFQCSEHSPDDLLCIAHTALSSTKDDIMHFVSSIFLRRLLHPGVHHNNVLRAAFLDFNRHWTDIEFQSLTLNGLKKEILSLMEHEGVNDSPISILYRLKNFCTRYFHHWCKHNAASGLLVQSPAGAVCLVRKNSVSLFRALENIELLIDGSSDEVGGLVSFEHNLSHNDSKCEILFEVLRCVISISQQLGKTASSIYYESLITPDISSEEIIARLIKILEIGYSSSVASSLSSGLGADIVWDKEMADHKNLRKFSTDMLLSLQALCKKATSWGNVLNVIESYLQFLVPQKVFQSYDTVTEFNIKASILVQATSQIAKVMFESTFDILLFVTYLVNISGRINMLRDDISRIQLELLPLIEETVSQWLIIYFFATTPSESPAIEDFSSQLSSLKIDGKTDKRSWSENLGKCDYTLGLVLLLTVQSSSRDPSHLSSRCLPSPQDIVCSVRDFTSWIIWGKTGQESCNFLRRATELALILLRHGQYNAVETILNIEKEDLRREKISRSIQDLSGDWCVLQHLLGCCFLIQAQCKLRGMLKDRKVCEAICCFFRASSGQGASQALQSLPREAGLPHLGFDGCVSPAAWKLHYYLWAMQIFEQYNISIGASQFALAALEQVDDALSLKDESCDQDLINESATSIKGRLWANVFKFTLDLNLLHDAYCAIISNPDEENKDICLRRFIIVLCEHGAAKSLCDGQLPFIGLTEKVERELAWKAERSDILAKPNSYKLLYAFEMHRHNWRNAASYIYKYSARLRTEAVLKDSQDMSLVLQERLNGLSATINALHLVNPTFAWIDTPLEESPHHNEHYSSKKAKKITNEQFSRDDVEPQRLQSYVDIKTLESEFVLTSAQYLLSLANLKWKFTGMHKAPSDLVELLIQANLYDMAFTVLLKFWKGSALNRELERVFSAMSLKCCPHKESSTWAGNDSGMHGLLLTSSMDELILHSAPDLGPTTQQPKGKTHWEILEHYLEKYKNFHARLPVTVAETLLRSDPHIELPLWLVHIFKGGRKERTWGMTGQESSPASLLKLYVDYGRYTEATNLLLEYLEAFASVRPAYLINRKKPFSVWFPYTIIERLWCQLEEMISLGHMVDQYAKLKNLLHGALLKHLQLLKVDSDDAISAALC